jgi:hypothetical protein
MPRPAAEALAECVLESGPLLTRFLDGFDDRTRTTQAPGLPNHVIWQLGHCALTMHRAADRLEGAKDHQALPTDQFVVGDGTAGDPARFDTESVAFGSEPIDNPRLYPRLKRGADIFGLSARRLAEVVYQLDGDLNDERHAVAWGGQKLTRARLICRVVFHNGTHAGQILDLRRALGMPKLH